MKNKIFAIIFVLTYGTLYADYWPDDYCGDGVFLRGDANGDGWVDVTDASNIFDYLHYGEPVPCEMDGADANDDGYIDISDGIMILDYIYNGEAPPAEPFPNAGFDNTPDNLANETSPPISETWTRPQLWIREADEITGPDGWPPICDPGVQRWLIAGSTNWDLWASSPIILGNPPQRVDWRNRLISSTNVGCNDNRSEIDLFDITYCVDTESSPQGAFGSYFINANLANGSQLLEGALVYKYIRIQHEYQCPNLSCGNLETIKIDKGKDFAGTYTDRLPIILFLILNVDAPGGPSELWFHVYTDITITLLADTFGYPPGTSCPWTDDGNHFKSPVSTLKFTKNSQFNLPGGWTNTHRLQVKKIKVSNVCSHEQNLLQRDVAQYERAETAVWMDFYYVW